MAETIRLNKVLRELNISLDRAVEFLDSKGVEIEKRPTTKISEATYKMLSDEFETDANKKVKSQEVSEAKLKEKEDLRLKREQEIEAKQKVQEAIEKAQQEEVVKATKTLTGPKQVGKIDLEPKKIQVEPQPVKEEAPKFVEEAPKTIEVTPEPIKVEEKPKEISKPKSKEEHILIDGELITPDEKVETKYKKLTGPTIAGDKIDLSQFNKPKKKKEDKKPEAKPGDASSANKKRLCFLTISLNCSNSSLE